MAGAVGEGLGVVGALRSASSNAMAADVDAKRLDAKARSIEAQAELDEAQQRRKNRLFLGEQNAKAATSGVAISVGSLLLHELDRVKQTEIEVQNSRIGRQNAVAATRFQS